MMSECGTLCPAIASRKSKDVFLHLLQEEIESIQHAKDYLVKRAKLQEDYQVLLLKLNKTLPVRIAKDFRSPIFCAFV
jgi:hypothetical protein